MSWGKSKNARAESRQKDRREVYECFAHVLDFYFTPKINFACMLGT